MMKFTQETSVTFGYIAFMHHVKNGQEIGAGRGHSYLKYTTESGNINTCITEWHQFMLGGKIYFAKDRN